VKQKFSGIKRKLPTRNEGVWFNSTYKKLAVQWLNEALCFVSSSVLADSFRLRNRQLLVAAKRQVVKKLNFPKKLVVVGVVSAGVNLRCIGFLFFLCGF